LKKFAEADIFELLNRMDSLIEGINLFLKDKKEENKNFLLNSLKKNFLKEFSLLREGIEKLASIALTKKQREILMYISNLEDATVFTRLAEEISEKFEMPKSTARWNLNRLKKAGLIIAGNKENKGIPVSLTYIGKIVARKVYIDNIRENKFVSTNVTQFVDTLEFKNMQKEAIEEELQLKML
jgi:DNA-binding MarR family transcriptional regulator